MSSRYNPFDTSEADPIASEAGRQEKQSRKSTSSKATPLTNTGNSVFYGETGQKLIQEAIRTRSNPILPAYRDDMIRDILLEVKYLYSSLAEIQTLSEQLSYPHDEDVDVNALTKLNMKSLSRKNKEHISKGLESAALMHSFALKRNKRCVLAYEMHRLRRIMDYLWMMGGGASTASVLSPEIKAHMSPLEIDFAQEYKSLASEYRGHFLDVNLGAGLVPPKDIFAEIRVIKDCGELLTESGPVQLAAGTQHYLRRADVENLILQGLVSHIS